MQETTRATLHQQITNELALRVIRAEQSSSRISFPNEAGLCDELGVSRTVLRESMKVLADKGMVEMRPRSGTRSRPKSHWRLLDPDILSWQAEVQPDAQFLRDLCEVRLAIEPTAAGFAAVRVSIPELNEIAICLARREQLAKDARLEAVMDADLAFHAAVVAASHNPLLEQLSSTIRYPYRMAALYASRFPANVALGLEAHFDVLKALRARDPIAARRAAEQAVGYAMLAVEEVIRAQEKPTVNKSTPQGKQ